MKINKEKLTKLRTQLGLSPSEAASTIGVSDTTIRRLEKGDTHTPHMSTVSGIAKAYGVSVHDLAQSEEEDAPRKGPSGTTTVKPQPLAQSEEEDAPRKGRLASMWDWIFSDEPGETFPFGFSIFFLLSCSIPQLLVTGIDPFALRRWFPNFTAIPALAVVSLGLFFLMSLVATTSFYLLGRRSRDASTVYPRAIWRVFPPLALVSVLLAVFFGGFGWAVFSIVALALFGMAFTTIVAFRDEEFSIDEHGKERVISHIWTATLLVVAGYAGFTTLVHLRPEVLVGVNHAFVFGSWDINVIFPKHTEHEILRNLRDANLLLNIATTTCIMGVGLYLLRTAYGLTPSYRSDTV